MDLGSLAFAAVAVIGVVFVIWFVITGGGPKK